MTDIVDELLDRAYSHKAGDFLCERAAMEIERLRLTVAEREAIYRAEARLRTAYVPDDETADTLRKLLERIK